MTPQWTKLVAAAVAHDINNALHSTSTGDDWAAPPEAVAPEWAEWIAFVGHRLQQLRRLGAGLRALASAGEPETSAILGDVVREALTEVEPPAGQIVRAETIPSDLRVLGAPDALRTAIASLLQHGLAASPPKTVVRMGMRTAAPSVGTIVLEIIAPGAWPLGARNTVRLDTLLDGDLRDLRGDSSLVLAGALADALGGAVHLGAAREGDLTLALHLRPCEN